MLKNVELAYIRKIAKMYVRIKDLPIPYAVAKAHEAYDFYKDAEMEMMYEDYERTN